MVSTLKLPDLQAIKAYLARWATKALRPGLLCISFFPDGIAAALVTTTKQKTYQLKWQVYEPYVENADLQTTLSAMVKKYNLSNIACSWLLQSSDYKILIMDAQPVAKAEMHDALRWQVKDLVNMPGQDIVLDYYPSPIALGRNKENSLGVVVANQKDLLTRVDLMRASGLTITTIDVPEFSMRNLLAAHPEMSRGLGIVLLQPEYCNVIMLQDQQIYMSRNIENALGTAGVTTDSATVDLSLGRKLSELALEIQRSLDYYVGQLRQNMPVKLFITLYQSHVFNYLAEQLSIPLEMLELDTALTEVTFDRTVLHRILPVVGGAFRIGSEHAATN